MNIAIIYGGRSGEHEVSLVSASFVVRAIGTEHTVHLIGITKNGEWYLQPESLLEHIRKDTDAVLTIERKKTARVAVIPGGGVTSGLSVDGKPITADVVFPVLHGSFGEDGTIQGGGVLASSAAMDKE